MQMRNLTASGPRVSAIGYWVGRTGPERPGLAEAAPHWDEDRVARDSPEATARHALGLGINFFHGGARAPDPSAPDPPGDVALKAILRETDGDGERRAHVAVAIEPQPGKMPPSPYCRWQDRYPAASVRAGLETRLRSLNTDHVDLVLLAQWGRAWNDDPQPLLVLRRLREEGKLDWIGVCVPPHDQNVAIQLMRDGVIDVVQLQLHLAHQEPVAQLLPVAAETGCGVIVAGRPRAGGRAPRQAIEEDLNACGLAGALTPDELEFAFQLAQPAVGTVVRPFQGPAEIDRVVRIAHRPCLRDDLLARLRRYDNSGMLHTDTSLSTRRPPETQRPPEASP